MRTTEARAVGWRGYLETGIILLSIVLLMPGGLAYLFAPEQLFLPLGISAGAEGMVDLRATYGGSQIGTSLILCWCLWRPEYGKLALPLLTIAITTVAVSRGIAIVAEQTYTGINLWAFLGELLAALLAGTLWATRRNIPDR